TLNIVAIYSAAGNFLGGGGSTTQTVIAATITTVGSNFNPSVVGQPVTLTATVTNISGAGTPAGKVEFFDGTTDLGPGSVLSGAGNAATSTLTISTLMAGAHNITAAYTASGNFLSGSGSLAQAVVVVSPWEGPALTYTAMGLEFAYYDYFYGSHS